MGAQSQIFFDSEGREWLKRNQHKLPPVDDPVLAAIHGSHLSPKCVLEVGCANGWRLKELAKRYKCECHGTDPGFSTKHGDVVTFYRGSADSLHIFKDGKFDLVIYGFCLYLCDPEDYFKIALEGDRVLADGGHLAVYDIYSPLPYKKPYRHKKGLSTYKMDFARLWSWSPTYSLQSVMMMGDGDTCTAVQILRKNLHTAFRPGPPPPS